MLCLLIARHGQSEGDTRHLVEGSADLPLTATGRLQGRLLAERLARDYRPAAVFTSTLQRARDIAEGLASLSDAPLFPDERLNEWSSGIMAGVPKDEAAVRWPMPERGHTFFELIPGAETAFEQAARVAEFIYNLIDITGEPFTGVNGARTRRFVGEDVRDLAPWEDQLKSAMAGRGEHARTFAFMTHGGTASRLIQVLLGLLPTSGPLVIHDDTGLSEVVIRNHRVWIHRVNCQSHLPPLLRAPGDRDVALEEPGRVEEVVAAWRTAQEVGMR